MTAMPNRHACSLLLPLTAASGRAQVFLSLEDKDVREIMQLQAQMDALKRLGRSGQDTSMEERSLITLMYNKLALQKVSAATAARNSLP